MIQDIVIFIIALCLSVGIMICISLSKCTLTINDKPFIEGLLNLLFEKRIISGPDGAPYMHRWYIFRTRPFSIMIHKFVRSDYDRALHDHPWNFLVIPIWRGYVEISEAFYCGLPYVRARRVYPILGTRYRSALYKHRVVLLQEGRKFLPAWSIFIRFTEWRKWGFWCKDGWKPWRPDMGDACEDDTRNVERMTEEVLLTRRQECIDWIESDANDGRLTTGSSAQLDFMGDTIEEINNELRRRNLS
jgi:hypothetical protein